MDTGIDLSSLNEKLILNERYNIKNEDLITDIVNRKVKFVSVIESIRDVLTNQDVTIRERGVEFLSWILNEIPSDLFNSQEISAIAFFYCDRLKDHHNITPSTIRGLLAIIKMKNIQKDIIKQIVVSLFKEVNCQTQQQSDRYNIFSIIGNIVENHLDIAAEMGADFVLGIISLADGETDPSNLLLLFKFLPKFLKNIDLGHISMEMFDFLSCYFPIDFNSSGKHLTITQEDLSQGLLNCLVARPDFADECFPLMLEKMDSTSKNAKIDSYKLLAACCNICTIKSISRYSTDLYKIIQKDVLPSKDSQISEVALSALSKIVKLFSSSETHRLIFEDFLNDILTSIKSLLCNIEDNLFQSAIDLSLAVSKSSVVAAKYVLNYLGNLLKANFTKDSYKVTTVLSSLILFLPILKEWRMSDTQDNDLLVIHTEFTQIFLELICFNNVEVKKLSFVGIQKLISDFDANMRSQLYEILIRCIKTEMNEEIRNECLNIVRQVGEAAPHEVLELIKSNFKIDVKSKNTTELNIFVAVLCTVLDIGIITNYAMTEIMNVITNSMHFDIGLRSLLNCCRRAEVSNIQFLKIIQNEYNVIERLIVWWIEEISEKKYQDTTLIKNLAEIIALIVRYNEKSVQQYIVDRFARTLLIGVELVNGNDENSVTSISNIEREKNIILVEAILGSIMSDVKLDRFSLLHLKLVKLAIKSYDQLIKLSSSRLLASIINKMSDNLLPEALKDVYQSISTSLDEFSPVSEKLNATFLLSWIIKGLLLANSFHLESLIFKWFELLERDDVGLEAAENFNIVLEENNLYLNMKAHCNIKILYRQRFFAYFPRLMKMFEMSKETSKCNYLLALTRLLEGLPKHVIMTEMPNVISVTAQSLDSNRKEIILSSLGILNVLLSDKEPFLADYVQTLIPKFLKLSRFEGFMKVRVCSLKCLYWYGFFPTISILPLKNEVVRSLEPCLDDKKRLVRNEAVKARNRWFLVGAPGEEIIFS